MRGFCPATPLEFDSCCFLLRVPGQRSQAVLALASLPVFPPFLSLSLRVLTDNYRCRKGILATPRELQRALWTCDATESSKRVSRFAFPPSRSCHVYGPGHEMISKPVTSQRTSAETSRQRHHLSFDFTFPAYQVSSHVVAAGIDSSTSCSAVRRHITIDPPCRLRARAQETRGGGKPWERRLTSRFKVRPSKSEC
ncbi:uncharacterized protein [Dermacentor albipictus]|uniref:uncharacterized protein n=1 Tax=Dermacentor albipictus TaxID=60249 RepID=UPI0038FCC40A